MLLIGAERLKHLDYLRMDSIKALIELNSKLVVEKIGIN